MIYLQVHSSSKCKEHWLKVQRDRGVAHPVMLPLDMPICWSSTFLLAGSGLKNWEVCFIYLWSYIAYKTYLLQSIHFFIFELANDERDDAKQAKIEALKMSSQEWTNLKEFYDVLQVWIDLVFPYSWLTIVIDCQQCTTCFLIWDIPNLVLRDLCCSMFFF